jgi:hypothetical protein
MKQKRGKKFKKNSAPVSRKVEDQRILMLRSWHKKVLSIKNLVSRRKEKVSI